MPGRLAAKIEPAYTILAGKMKQKELLDTRVKTVLGREVAFTPVGKMTDWLCKAATGKGVYQRPLKHTDGIELVRSMLSGSPPGPAGAASTDAEGELASDSTPSSAAVAEDRMTEFALEGLDAGAAVATPDETPSKIRPRRRAADIDTVVRCEVPKAWRSRDRISIQASTAPKPYG